MHLATSLDVFILLAHNSAPFLDPNPMPFPLLFQRCIRITLSCFIFIYPTLSVHTLTYYIPRSLIIHTLPNYLRNHQIKRDPYSTQYSSDVLLDSFVEAILFLPLTSPFSFAIQFHLVVPFRSALDVILIFVYLMGTKEMEFNRLKKFYISFMVSQP